MQLMRGHTRPDWQPFQHMMHTHMPRGPIRRPAMLSDALALVPPPLLLLIAGAGAVPLFLAVYASALQHPNFKSMRSSTRVFCASAAKDLAHASLVGPLGVHASHCSLSTPVSRLERHEALTFFQRVCM